MTVFIAHAKADAEAAETLKQVLDLRGLHAELEDGSRGYRPIGPQDAVVALWSKDALFDHSRLMFEKRALDAWADGGLVLVKLDRQFAPVGLRDLPAVDASFEVQRDLVAWPEVAKRIAQAKSAKTAPRPAAPKSMSEGAGGAPGGESRAADRMRREMAKEEESDVRADREEASDDVAAPAKTRGGGFLGGLFGRRKKAAKAPAPQPADAPAPAPAAMEAPPDAVFISYARADSGTVLPVCEALKRDGKSLWMDLDGIDAGENWAGEIVRAIRTVRGVAVMCSKAAFESDHVKREVYLADRYKKRMLPVLLDDTPMPDDFEFFFAGIQWLKLHETPEKDRPAAVAKALELA